jgi:hypothetical protein
MQPVQEDTDSSQHNTTLHKSPSNFALVGGSESLT